MFANHVPKKHTVKFKPIAIFCLSQIPGLYLAALSKSAVTQTLNRTKTFHVKRFGTIEPSNRTKLMFSASTFSAAASP